MEIICWRFRFWASFTFWDIHTWDIWNVCLQTFRNNRICWKLAYLSRNLQTLRAINSRILRIKNAKFSGHCFYMNTNIQTNFQICISLPLINAFQSSLDNSKRKPNKIWLDQGSEFYYKFFKKWLEDNDIEMHSTYRERNCVVAERFIRTLKNRIYKHMTAVSKNVYFDVLNDIVNK